MRIVGILVNGPACVGCGFSKCEECGAACHPDTYALGTKSGKNDARDFWRFVNSKIDARRSKSRFRDSRYYINFRSIIMISDFIRSFKEFEEIRVPCKNKKLGLVMETHPILYPHCILAFLFDDVGVYIDPNDVKKYWEHSRSLGEPWAVNSDATSAHIPLGIHGDGARLLTQVRYEKQVGIWMNLVLWRPRSVRYSRWLLYSIPYDKVFKNRSFNVIWRALVWSFSACFDGVNPTVGPPGCARGLQGEALKRAGTPICKAGHCFAVTEYRGDWEWHRDVWRPQASWTSNQVCMKCPALAKSEDPSLLYYCYGPENECGWLRNQYSAHGFVAERLRSNNL